MYDFREGFRLRYPVRHCLAKNHDLLAEFSRSQVVPWINDRLVVDRRFAILIVQWWYVNRAWSGWILQHLQQSSIILSRL